jgi:uncharacterized protein YjbI with pentapeptide repeats
VEFLGQGRGYGLTMSDRPDDPESGAGEPKPPKKKAEDNPWYLLATLYGVPGKGVDDELRKKNRIAWNRYFAASLNEETRTKLSEEKRHPEQELRPFWPQELREVKAAFDKRRGSKTLDLRSSDARIDFSNVEFDRDVSFEQYLFGDCSFQEAYFSGEAWFAGATFSDKAIFKGATFSGKAWYPRVTVSGKADFAGATFSVEAWFPRATFSGGTDFRCATFSGVTLFSDATFSGVADFQGTKFLRRNFFINTEMKGETRFQSARFSTEPPKFFGAKLHEGTIWPSGNDKKKAWPIPESQDVAEDFIRAYERLKLEMDRLKKHEDELDFFALEMQSRRVLLGPLRGLPIWLYGILSNYGRSYVRPLAWFFVIAVACAPVFRHFGAKATIDALGLSVANLLSVFGFRKDFNLPIDSLPVALKILGATQTIVGGALLFLFGLGVRNKFRMK